MKAFPAILFAGAVTFASFSSFANRTSQAPQSAVQAASTVIAQDIATRRDIDAQIHQLQSSTNVQAQGAAGAYATPNLAPLKGFRCAGHHTCMEDDTAACTSHC